MQLKNTHFVGKWEVSCLVLYLTTHRLFTHLPSVFSDFCGTAAPLASVLSGIIAFAIISLLLFLYRKCDCCDMITLSQKVFGTIGKYAASAVILLYILLSSAFSMREISLLVSQIAFPTAPLWFIAIFFAVAALLAALHNFDVISRVCVLIVPAVILSVFIVLISVFGYAQYDNLFPFLGNGIDSVFEGGLSGLLIYSDIILLFLINPFSNKDNKAEFKTALLSAGGGIILITALIIIFSATTAYPESASIRFPIYQLLKMVYYGRFFQRIDSVFMLIAVLSEMLFISTAIHFASHTATSLLGGTGSVPKERNGIIYSVIAIIISFAAALSFDLFSDSELKQFLCIFASASLIITAFPALLNAFIRYLKKPNEG